MPRWRDTERFCVRDGWKEILKKQLQVTEKEFNKKK